MESCILLYFTADWVDVRDPNVIAETELLQAAASIEAAAKKLAELKPKRTVVCITIMFPIRSNDMCSRLDQNLHSKIINLIASV